MAVINIDKEKTQKIAGEVISSPSATQYRMQWLMAHKRLYAAVHDPSVSLPELWAAYLEELTQAKGKAKIAA